MIRVVVLLLGLLAGGLYAASRSSDALLFAANLPDRLWGEPTAGLELAYGTDPAQRLSVYGRASEGPKRPVVIFWHGGRWSFGDKDQYRFVGETLVRSGAVVVLGNYRLYPSVRMEAAMADVAATIALVQAHATEWGGDPRRVVLMGHSAGAQLAALASLDQRWVQRAGGSPVQGLVGIAGPYDFLPLTDDDLKDYFGPPEAYPASQPINFVRSTGMPVFLVHGRSDQTVWPRNTEHLAAALQRAGAPVEVHYLEGEDHGAVLTRFIATRRAADPVIAALARFVSRVPAATDGVAAGYAAGTR